MYVRSEDKKIIRLLPFYIFMGFFHKGAGALCQPPGCTVGTVARVDEVVKVVADDDVDLVIFLIFWINSKNLVANLILKSVGTKFSKLKIV